MSKEMDYFIRENGPAFSYNDFAYLELLVGQEPLENLVRSRRVSDLIKGIKDGELILK